MERVSPCIPTRCPSSCNGFSRLYLFCITSIGGWQFFEPRALIPSYKPAFRGFEIYCRYARFALGFAWVLRCSPCKKAPSLSLSFSLRVGETFRGLSRTDADGERSSFFAAQGRKVQRGEPNSLFLFSSSLLTTFLRLPFSPPPAPLPRPSLLLSCSLLKGYLLQYPTSVLDGGCIFFRKSLL